MSDSFVFADHSSTKLNGSNLLSRSKSNSSKKSRIALSELLSSENKILSLNDTMTQSDKNNTIGNTIGNTNNNTNGTKDTNIKTANKPYVILGLNEQAPFILSDPTTNKVTVNDISTPTSASKTFDFDYIFQNVNDSSPHKKFRLQQQQQQQTQRQHNNNPMPFLTPKYHDTLINDILNGFNVTIVMCSMNDKKDFNSVDEENNTDDRESFKSSRSSKSSNSFLSQANYSPNTDTQKQDGETPHNKDIYTLIDNLFKQLQSGSNKLEHTIKCCCLEFTNDGKVYDLINSNTRSAYNNTYNTNENSISFDESSNEIKGQEYVYLSNYSDFADVLSISNLNRKNQYNSNVVSTIKLSRSEFGEGLIKNSTINLIDLSNHNNSFENLNLLNSLLRENKSSSSNTLSKLFNTNAKLTFIMDLLNLSDLETSFNVINTCSEIRENFSNNDKNIKQNVDFTYDLLKRKFVELQNENREYKSKVNLLENEKLNFKFNNSEINSRTLNTFKLKNKALKDEIFGLKNLLEFYKLSNEDSNNSKNSISKDQTLNILNESFNDLTLNQTRLMEEMEFHCNKVNELTNTINNYNEKLNYYNDNDKKIESLEKSLNQFTLHIDQIEIQNQNLKTEINSINKLCDLKQEKIKYLESKLIDQNKNVSHDSSFFEDRLSFLKTRLISSKSALSTSSTTSNSTNNNNNSNSNNNGSMLNHQIITSAGSSSSYSNSNSLNYLDYSSTSLPDLPTSPNTTASSYSELMNDNLNNDILKPNIKIRSGFNLRIVKPSGENDFNES
ncbi:hypothetical protein BVG19_g1379 [[Candida] boidinii]|nr:hypothetical protein BVG19_g1379 [[Candida] boidinii]OWB53314.1 hypothetical protein B5S27_g4908 [[Candida] boidinii]